MSRSQRPPTADARERVIVVGSLPGTHPFVDALLDSPRLDRRQLDHERLDAPTALHAQLPPLAELDVLVANFGFEGHETSVLRHLLHDAVRHRCVVATIVHDLENPHLPAHLQRRHHRQLSLLVDAGLVVATLSEHAREQLRRDHDVDALLLPHPPLGPARAPARTAEPASVLVHLKSMRRNVLGQEAVAAATRLACEGRAAPIVCVHRDATLDAHTRSSLAAADREDVEVRRHGRLTHDELVALLADVEVLVLPYSHGTHSGLLDLALDVGTKVVAPSVGAYGEQGATATFNPRARDVVSELAHGMEDALAAPVPDPRDHAVRQQRFEEARDRLLDRLACEVAAVGDRAVAPGRAGALAVAR